MAKKSRNIQVIKDLDGNNIVIINDLIFKGKKRINWKDVETYLRKYVGEFYEIAETKDIVYIGSDFPSEFSYSKYTKKLIKSSAKVKANIIEAIPEMVKVANEKDFMPNLENKHKNNAKLGWYKYRTNFALPKYSDNGDVISYKMYKAMILIRASHDNKLYLYDIIQIFKD